jgi:hypothetical protein
VGGSLLRQGRQVCLETAYLDPEAAPFRNVQYRKGITQNKPKTIYTLPHVNKKQTKNAVATCCTQTKTVFNDHCTRLVIFVCFIPE